MAEILPTRAAGDDESLDAYGMSGRFAGSARLLLPAGIATLLVTPAMTLGAFAPLMTGDLVLSPTDIGGLFALFFVGSAAGARASGRVARRYGATTVVTWCLVWATCGCALMAVWSSVSALAVGGVVGGLVNGIAAAAINLVILGSVPKRRHGLAFGLRFAAPPTMATLAATAAYMVSAWGWSWASFYWLCAAAGPVLILLLRGLRVRAIDLDPVSSTNSGRNSMTLTVLAAAGLVSSMATTAIGPFLLTSLVVAGQTPATSAMVVALGGWTAIVGRVLAGFVSDRVPRPTSHLLFVAAMLSVCAGAMVTLARVSVNAAVICAALVVMAFGWTWPGLLHHAVIALHREAPERASSAMQSSTYLGAVLGPYLFGVTVDSASFAAGWAMSGALAAVAAAALVVGVRLARLQGRRHTALG